VLAGLPRTDGPDFVLFSTRDGVVIPNRRHDPDHTKPDGDVAATRGVELHRSPSAGSATMPSARGSLGCSASGMTWTFIHGQSGSDDTALVHGGGDRRLVQPVVRRPARDPPQPLAQARSGQFLAATQLGLEDLLLQVGHRQPAQVEAAHDGALDRRHPLVERHDGPLPWQRRPGVPGRPEEADAWHAKVTDWTRALHQA
jgi:hypothetical protein